ncbi:MAG: hypothetical protein JXA98_02445 [Methanosarcinaceae archaeon]|nr:hypothetical protein [Methanosarcinaceae archaeon]
MDIESEEVYTLVIPVSPQSKQNDGYIGGSQVGEVEPTYEHLKENGGVVWAWGLSPAGLKNSIKKGNPKLGMRNFIDRTYPELFRKLGVPVNINGKMVKISKTGYFYSTRDETRDKKSHKLINWKFEATSISNKVDIKKNKDFKETYIPSFRQGYFKMDEWDGSLLLITDLKKLEKPFEGKLIENKLYVFPTFDYEFYSNTKNKLVTFNTNHLTSGNAFVMEKR